MDWFRFNFHLNTFLSAARRDVEDRLRVFEQSTPDVRERLLPDLLSRQAKLESLERGVSEHADSIAKGEFPSGSTEFHEALIKSPAILHNLLIVQAPRLAQKLVGWDWSVFAYSEHTARITSDSPVLILPVTEPAINDDYRALLNYADASLGRIPVLDLPKPNEHPPLTFILPLTPHLDLLVAPHDWKRSLPKDAEKAIAHDHNLFQVLQANRFLFSYGDDFSMVNEALEFEAESLFLADEQLPDQVLTATSTYDELSYEERWKPIK